MVRGLTLEVIREVALALPGVVEGLSYRTPAFRVGGKIVCRLHQDGRTLVVHCDPFERELLLDSDRSVFFLTDHYLHHTWILVRLETATRGQLEKLLRHTWELLGGRAAGKRKPRPRRPRTRR